MPTIRQEIVIHAPCERCFDLTRSVDFHVASAQKIAARADGGRRTGLSGDGDFTVWSARFFGVRTSMVTQIEDYTYASEFRDRMTMGLLRQFEHTYRFALTDSGCVLSDELVLEAPFLFLGRIVERAYLRSPHGLSGRRTAGGHQARGGERRMAAISPRLTDRAEATQNPATDLRDAPRPAYDPAPDDAPFRPRARPPPRAACAPRLPCEKWSAKRPSAPRTLSCRFS